MLYTTCITTLAGYPIQIMHSSLDTTKDTGTIVPYGCLYMLAVYRKGFSLYIIFVVVQFTLRINRVLLMMFLDMTDQCILVVPYVFKLMLVY